MVTSQPVRPSVNHHDPGGPREEGGHSAPGEAIRRTLDGRGHGGEDMVMGAEEDIFEIPDEEVEEDVEQLKVAPSPLLPSPSEVEDHRITHYPYRS